MSTRRPVAPERRSRPSRSGGLVRAAFQIGFWIPLLFCTWAALIPAPPDNPVFQLSDVLLHAAAFTYLSFAFVLAWLESGSRLPDDLPGHAQEFETSMALSLFPENVRPEFFPEFFKAHHYASTT